MKRPKNKALRWVKRNCIKVPFYGLAFVALAAASNLERPEDKPDFKIPPTVYEVYAAERITENSEKVAVTAEKEPVSVEEMIVSACADYGINHEIPLAIARLETGHFTSAAYLHGNNVGGMSVDEIPMEFDSLSDGVNAFVENLAQNYFAVGLDTPKEIGEKYCPVNPEWVDVVSQLM